MKFLQVIKKIMKGLVSLIYVALFVLCCFSWPMSESGVSTPIIGTPNINFAAGSFPVDTVDLAVPLQPGEVSLLSGFSALGSVDFSGSTCYDEFIPWIEAHPEISARYTVALPTGEAVEWNVDKLDLTGMDSEAISQAAKVLPYLPNLAEINLGSESGGASLLPVDIAALQEACPEVKLSYLFSMAGKDIILSDERLDLTSLSREEVERAATMLSSMSALTYVDLGGEGANDLAWEDVGTLQAANPNAEFKYSFTLYDQSLTTLDEVVSFSHITMYDEGEAVRRIMPYMQKCTYLDMDFCGVSNESMAAIRDEFPDTKVVWRIWFGENYSVRTDVEKILASKPTQGGVVNDEQAWVLRYCTDVKYLDLGHNEAITDISFVSCMPNLEVFVIAMNPLEDISPLANCTHLEYIELNSTNISDLSPLADKKELRHLNIGNCKSVSDISPLYGLTDLERLWIGCFDPVPAEQVAIMQEAAPDCKIDTTTDDPTQGGWRYADLNDKGWATWVKYGYFDFDLHPRYELLREQFGYADLAYSFTWLDPLY